MKEDGHAIVFTSPGEGVTGLDVHPLNKVFAFAELSLNPAVFVFKYPELELVSTLRGETTFIIIHEFYEFCSFNTSTILCSCFEINWLFFNMILC